MDGVTWEKVGSASGWAPNTDTKTLNLEIPSYAKYVKVKTTQVGTRDFMGKSLGYLTAAEFKFFENYHVRSAEIDRLAFDASAARKDYQVGDRLDFTGVETMVHFKDGSKARIPAAAFEWDADILDAEGPRTVTGTYEGHTVSFDVNVKANDRVATKIESVVADNRTYYAGEAVAKDALEVKVTDGASSWYLLPDQFEVDKPLVEGKETYTVTSMGGLTGTVEITAEAGVTSLAAAWTDAFSGNYVLGDVFDPQQVAVTLGRAGNTSEVIGADRYAVEVVSTKDGQEVVEPIEVLTDTPGTKKLRFTLKDHTLAAELDATVLPYVNEGPFTVEVSADGKSCTLTGYTPEAGYESSIVKIPGSVVVGGKEIPVTAVGSSAFNGAADLTSVQLPASVQHVATGAFATCSKLTNVFMTDYTTLDGFTCEEGAFPQVENGLVFLNAALGQVESPIPGYKVGDLAVLAKSIKLVEPVKKNYLLEEEFDATGMEVYGVLADGSLVPTPNYDMEGFDSSTIGDKTVTVSLQNTQLSASFAVNVEFPEVVIDSQPVGGAYTSADAIKPLEVRASTASAKPSYQWYRSDTQDGTFKEIAGATEASYRPDQAGYYYAEVYMADAAGNTSTPVQTDTVRVDVNEGYVAAVDGVGYASVKEAVESTTGDVTVEMLDDSKSPNEIIITGRSVTIEGNGHTLTRGDFSNPVFNMRNDGTTQSLTLKNMTVDGAAVWEGDVDDVLGRGTVATGRTGSWALIDARGPGSSVAIEGVTLQNNDGTAGGEGGGAVYLRDSSSLTATNSAIRDCNTDDYGGAIWAKYRKNNAGKVSIKLDDVDISGCSAGKDGGGVFVSEFSYLEMVNSSLSGNRAFGVVGQDGTKQLGRGGSVFVESYAETPYIANTTIENSAACYGGGLGALRKLSLSGVSFTGNTAERDGGAVHVGEYRDGDKVINGGSDVTVENGCLFEDNAADGAGGAVYAQTVSSSGNTYGSNRAQSDGGAVYAGGKASTTNDAFNDNVSVARGGGLFVGKGLTLSGSSFVGNDADERGDGVFLSEGTTLDVFSVGKDMQEVFVAVLDAAKIRILADLKGGSLPFEIDGPVSADMAIAQCLEQAGDLNVTLNGGKLKRVGAVLYLADGWQDVSAYRPENGALSAPTQEGKVFAGWYTTDDPSQMNESTALPEDARGNRVAYPRFVDAEVLTVKRQVTASAAVDAETVNLRLLSSVAGLNYRFAGFKVQLGDGEPLRKETDTVLNDVTASYESGAKTSKPGEVFGTDATHFIAYEYRDIEREHYDVRMTVTPFWVTFDGTEVDGEPRSFTVREAVEANRAAYDDVESGQGETA